MVAEINLQKTGRKVSMPVCRWVWKKTGDWTSTKKDAMLANWEAADAELSLWDMGACKPVPDV